MARDGERPSAHDFYFVVAQDSRRSVSGQAAAADQTRLGSFACNTTDGSAVTKKGCTHRLGVNRPRDYLCYNPATHKSDEVLFTFAALDATVTTPCLADQAPADASTPKRSPYGDPLRTPTRGAGTPVVVPQWSFRLRD